MGDAEGRAIDLTPSSNVRLLVGEGEQYALFDLSQMCTIFTDSGGHSTTTPSPAAAAEEDPGPFPVIKPLMNLEIVPAI